MCLRGVAAIEQEWLARTQRSDVAVYVVWVPELGARERHVAGATRLMSDPRVTHYWDQEEAVGKSYAKQILGIDDFALWDFYMLFDRAASWRDAHEPVPRVWMHQLYGLDPDKRLDADRFRAEAATLLAQPH